MNIFDRSEEKPLAKSKKKTFLSKPVFGNLNQRIVYKKRFPISHKM